MGALTACGDPPAGTRTTDVPSRTTQASCRVAATVGALIVPAVRMEASSPSYGPANRVAPYALAWTPARNDSSPLVGSADTAALESPYAPVPAGPGVGSPEVTVWSAPPFR